MKTLRISLAVALALAPVASAVAFDRAITSPRIKDNGDVELAPDLVIGKSASGKLDLSDQRVVPSVSAAAGSVARLFADRLATTGGALTGPLTTSSRIAIGQNVGAASRLLATDTSMDTATDRPTVFLFRQENYQNDSNTFHNPFVAQLNSSGLGPRQTLTVQSNYDGHNGSDFLVGAQFRNTMTSGSGFSIPVATQCFTSSTTASTCHGIEIAVEGTGPLTRSVGSHIINGWYGTNTPSVDMGILINAVGTSPGWKQGLVFGLDKFPIRPGGVLIDTMTSNVALRAAIDLSKSAAGTEGTVLLPFGGTVKFGGGAGAGGSIASLTASGAGALVFADGNTFIDFADGRQNRFAADGIHTSGVIQAATAQLPYGGTFFFGPNGDGGAIVSQGAGAGRLAFGGGITRFDFGNYEHTFSAAGYATTGTITAPNLPTTGTVRGSVCIDTSGKLYVKTSSGACL